MDCLNNYADSADLCAVWKQLTTEESTLADEVMTTVSALIRAKAAAVGQDFDKIVNADANMAQIAKSVTCDATKRYMDSLGMNSSAGQLTQSAGGYSVTLTPTIAGGGVYLLDNELKRLGILRQRIRFVDMAGD